MKYFVLAFLVLAACTRPYQAPRIVPDRGFLGAADYLDPRFQPDPREPRVRAILTHGMCSHLHRADGDADTGNWVAMRAGQIARATGGRVVVSDPLVPDKTYAPAGVTSDTEAMQRYDIPIATPAGVIDAVFLVWGRQVDPYRANLEYENTSRSEATPDAPIRARFNATLKTELMNRCLIDAVVYLGENGNPIRRNMRHALCDILGGAFGSGPNPGDPRRPDRCTRPVAADHPTVLIPESLGSTILFEAVEGLDDGARQARIAGSLASIRAIYLASNQLPFLEQGNRPARADAAASLRDAMPGALGDFLSLLGRGSVRGSVRGPVPREALGDAGRAAARRVQLVAITDPNDVLGYRLDPEVYGAERFPWIDLRNVLVSNTTTYFGLLANPLAAHSGTARDPVFELIAGGAP